VRHSAAYDAGKCDVRAHKPFNGHPDISLVGVTTIVAGIDGVFGVIFLSILSCFVE
jgi:hypothetical protein